MEEAGTNEKNEYSEISIWLDKYADLFSEYDESHFKARTLSDNFLTEIRKLVHEAPTEKVEMKFNLMADEANAETETLIIDNIHSYFESRAKDAKNKKFHILRKGGLLTLAGFALITFIILVGHTWSSIVILRGFEMMLDPLGWFLTWTGLDMIFVQSKKEQPHIDFNMRMTNAKLTFAAFGMPEVLAAPAVETDELRLAS